MLRATALFASFLLSACAVSVYAPPNLAPEELSTLAFEQKGGIISLGSVALEKIDGQAPSMGTAMSVVRHRTPVVVSPGKHTVQLSFAVGASYGGQTLWFVAERGIAYIARGRSEGYKFSLWIEEELTGIRVGGIQGSEDEPK